MENKKNQPKPAREVSENLTKNEVTKEDFESYESVRLSGATNMWDTKTVEELSGLPQNKIMAIMKDYGVFELSERYCVETSGAMKYGF